MANPPPPPPSLKRYGQSSKSPTRPTRPMTLMPGLYKPSAGGSIVIPSPQLYSQHLSVSQIPVAADGYSPNQFVNHHASSPSTPVNLRVRTRTPSLEPITTMRNLKPNQSKGRRKQPPRKVYQDEVAEDDDLVMMPFEIQEVRTAVKTEPSDDIVEVVHPTAVQALQPDSTSSEIVGRIMTSSQRGHRHRGDNSTVSYMGTVEGASDSEVDEPDDIMIDTESGHVYNPNDQNTFLRSFSQSANNNPRQYECSRCNITLSSNKEFQHHTTLHHRSNAAVNTGKFKCLLCEYSTNYKQALQIHSVVHGTSPPYTCILCSTRFSSTEEINAHVAVHTGQHNLKCRFTNCEFTTKNSSLLNRHYRATHGRNSTGHKSHKELNKHDYICDKCPYSTSKYSSFTIHQFKHQARYHCSMCSYSCLAHDAMRKHYVSSHRRHGPTMLSRSAAAAAPAAGSVVMAASSATIEDKLQKCIICEYKTSYLDEMNRHVDNQHTIKKCSMCDYSTVNRRAYNLHVENHVTNERPMSFYGDYNDEEGEFFCDTCFFRTIHIQKWKKHSCPADGSKFKISGLDYSHNPAATSECLSSPSAAPKNKQLSSDSGLYCKKCDIRFMSDADYSSHMKFTHVGTFQCNLCDFSSEHERWLDSHMSTHAAGAANATLFRCHLCAYTCMHRARLQQHLNTHKGIRPYTCAVCNYTGNNMSNMYRHVRGKHQIFDLDVLKSYVVRQTPVENRWLPDQTGSVGDAELSPTKATVSPSTPGRKKSNRSVSKEGEPVEAEVSKKRKETVDTQQHREDINTDRSLPQIFSCETCYYTTRDQESLSLHMKTCHDVSSSATQENQVQSIDNGSFANRLADIVKPAKERKVVQNIDFTKFRSPPDGVLRSPSSTPFKRADLLISSTVRINGSTVAQYKCKVCKVKSFDRQQLLEHITVEHMMTGSLEHLLPYVRKNKAYYCQLCDYETPVTVNLKGHYLNHHPDDKTFKPKLDSQEDDDSGGTPSMVEFSSAHVSDESSGEVANPSAVLTDTQNPTIHHNVRFIGDDSVTVANEAEMNLIPEGITQVHLVRQADPERPADLERPADIELPPDLELAADTVEDKDKCEVSDTPPDETVNESSTGEVDDSITLHTEDEIGSQLLLVTARHMTLDH